MKIKSTHKLLCKHIKTIMNGWNSGNVCKHYVILSFKGYDLLALNLAILCVVHICVCLLYDKEFIKRKQYRQTVFHCSIKTELMINTAYFQS